MKKVLFCLSMVAMLMTACSKDEEENNNSALPPLPNPNDVCSAMDDAEFMKFCYDKFDINKDGAVSRAEADVVRIMDLEEESRTRLITSLKGIGYFPNLEHFRCTDIKTKKIDLSYNTKLIAVHIHSDNLNEVVLPEKVIAMDMQTFFSCDNLTTVYCKASVPPTSLCDYRGIGNDLTVKIITDASENEYFWFEDCPISKIYVPKATVSAYKQAKVWRKYASKIEGYNF